LSDGLHLSGLGVLYGVAMIVTNCAKETYYFLQKIPISLHLSGLGVLLHVVYVLFSFAVVCWLVQLHSSVCESV